jgi:cytochrome c-type biogenesis protein CcmH/NrfF
MPFLTRIQRSLGVCVTLCTLLMVCTSIHAQSNSQNSSTQQIKVKADAQKRVNRLSDQLKSPFCPGKTLMTCTSFEAYRLRQEMTAMILAGKNDKQILLALRDSFGDQLENPPQPWYTVLVPILPFVFGLLVALWMFSRWMKGSKEESAEFNTYDEVDDSHKSRLQDLMQDD